MSMKKAIAKRFEDFYENEWHDRDFYTPSELADKFNTDRHLSRYYLMLMVYARKLIRMKYSNKTSYCKNNKVNYDALCEYIWIGVELTKKGNIK